MSRLDGITLGYRDRARAQAFYAAALAPLGMGALVEREAEVGFGRPGAAPVAWLLRPFNGLPPTWGNGTHVAFLAGSREAVEGFYKAGLAAGGLDEGAPGLRLHYADDYYAAYLRDPDGNKLQAVHYLGGDPATVEAEPFSHITLGCNDLERGRAFYDPVMASLGLARVVDEPDLSYGYGRAGSRLPWVYAHRTFDGRPATWANGFEVVWQADDPRQVEAWHAAGLANGGFDEGAPGPRSYRPGYFGAYLRDPDGNKLHAFCLAEGRDPLVRPTTE
ncbi:Catechol 2,3-dioxygenase [Tistlia consotensis]|uniref:Catechol 2,3-dioxygenase n=1 Tax=Tistlia consotensis USBA 355 TaxID=560819 RepID=A0A1Y6BM76_9PROT|nr:VOC family protein [Tistlia consotensis]SMF09873.1 Catechol 2,3-dioxygenase [Tistlia consotensis USBA 355]SNR34195.1 Catechol 2,3-dioxygenase [Tistlia consotensis]